MSTAGNLISIGKLSRPVGIKGHLKLILLTDFPKRIKQIKSVYLLYEEGKKLKNDYTGSDKFEIESADLISDYIKIKFKFFDNPESIVKLKDCYVCIDEKDKIKLPKGKHYLYEYSGCKIYNGKYYIGEVTGIENYGGDDLLKVKTEKKEILIPLRKEFIKKIDIENKKIFTTLIDGLI